MRKRMKSFFSDLILTNCEIQYVHLIFKLTCLTHSSSPPKICFFRVLPEKDHLYTHSCAVRTSVDILWCHHSLHLASNQSSPGRLTY